MNKDERVEYIGTAKIQGDAVNMPMIESGSN
jgi:hypothetical protein